MNISLILSVQGILGSRNDLPRMEKTLPKLDEVAILMYLNLLTNLRSPNYQPQWREERRRKYRHCPSLYNTMSNYIKTLLQQNNISCLSVPELTEIPTSVILTPSPRKATAHPPPPLCSPLMTWNFWWGEIFVKTLFDSFIICGLIVSKGCKLWSSDQVCFVYFMLHGNGDMIEGSGLRT